MPVGNLPSLPPKQIINMEASSHFLERLQAKDPERGKDDGLDPAQELDPDVDEGDEGGQRVPQDLDPAVVTRHATAQP